MGDRSDKQYHGGHDPDDWKKGKRPRTDRSVAQTDADREAYWASRVTHDANKVLTMLKDSFKKTAAGYERAYGGAFLAGIGDSLPQAVASALPYQAAGIALRDMACRCGGFPNCTDMEKLTAALQAEYAGKSPGQKGSVSRRLGKLSMTLTLTEAQYKQCVDYYTAQIGKDGGGPAAGR